MKEALSAIRQASLEMIYGFKRSFFSVRILWPAAVTLILALYLWLPNSEGLFFFLMGPYMISSVFSVCLCTGTGKLYGILPLSPIGVKRLVMARIFLSVALETIIMGVAGGFLRGFPWKTLGLIYGLVLLPVMINLAVMQIRSQIPTKVLKKEAGYPFPFAMWTVSYCLSMAALAFYEIRINVYGKNPAQPIMLIFAAILYFLAFITIKRLGKGIEGCEFHYDTAERAAGRMRW